MTAAITSREAHIEDEILAAVAEHPGLSGTELIREHIHGVFPGNHQYRDAVRRLEASGRLRVQPGARGAGLLIPTGEAAATWLSRATDMQRRVRAALDEKPRRTLRDRLVDARPQWSGDDLDWTSLREHLEATEDALAAIDEERREIERRIAL